MPPRLHQSPTPTPSSSASPSTPAATPTPAPTAQQHNHPQLPTIASWNVCHIDAATVQHQRAFLGDRTGIICNVSAWTIDNVIHTDFTTSACIRFSDDCDPITLVSVYLPAQHSRRLTLIAEPEFRSHFFADSLTPSRVQRTIVMGDFNELESPSDSFTSGRRAQTSAWPETQAALAPLVPIFRRIHPSKEVFSYFRIIGTPNFASSDATQLSIHPSVSAATRIDHCFASEAMLGLIHDMQYVPEPGTSDHCAVIISGAPHEVELPPSYRLFKIHHAALLDATFMTRLSLALHDIPTERMVSSLRVFMFSIKNTARRELNALNIPINSIDRGLEELRLKLVDFQLDASSAVAFTDLVLRYERLRSSAFPEERADFLRLQPDLPIWSKKRLTRRSTPLDPAQVTEFYQELFSHPAETDRCWEATASNILNSSTVVFPEPTDLIKPFTGLELLAALKRFKKRAAPGLNGIPVDALLAGGIQVMIFLADVLNSVLKSDKLESFHFVIRGSLLFKKKPGNQVSFVSHYRALSVMDVEARLLHAVVGNRIKAQLKDAIPSTQQRFLPGRNGALNVIKLIVLAESNNRGILRRPGMVISQDQHKAYDVLSRDWVLHTLTAAGAPTEFINLVSSLWADSTIVFHVDEGECPPVLVGRGLPQGVISSVMLYLLAYQPFIDAWENTRGGISVQVGDESYRLSSISYADNSDFFLGSKKDLTAFKKLRTHFDRVSDSSINPSESFATILRNQSSPPLPDWFKEALDLYPERKADSAFKYLGRTLRMDGLPCAGLPNRVSKALHSAAHHIRRHFSLFSAARALHDFGFSKIALMFDGPYDYEETFKAIKLEARKYFYDGNGQSIRWDLLSLPRNLGGLGLLDPILANEISLVRQICSIFVGNDSDLKGLIVALMALEYNDICGCPLSSLLAAPVKAVSRIEIGHKSFSRRCLFALQLLGLNSSMPTDLASADPTAVVLLPFHSTYPFDLSDFTRADDWERCVDILRSLGISSFLDLLWEDQSLRVEDDGSQSKLTRLRLRPPRMDEVRAFHPKVEIFDARAQRYGFQPATAFNLLQQNWPKLLAAWPSTFVDLLARFFEARPNFAGIPLRGSSRARPHADRLKPNLPFDLLTISDLPLSKFTTKAGRSWYYGTKCAMPGNPNNDYQGLHAHNTFLLPGAGLGLDSSDSDDDFETVEETTPLASASEWRLEVHWKSVWPFLHELILPGVGRACWWLILHQRASVARTATYKVARCPGCCEVSSSSDHIYLECPHFRKVWLALAEVAVAVVGETFDLAMIRTATPGAIALGFPTIYSSLRPIGRIRFKVWVAICMSVMMSAVRGLPRGDAQSTPPSLDPLRLRTKCVKEMFGFTCLFHAGPSRLSSSQFESHWLANNRLILKSGSKLLLHNIGLIPVASPTHFSQDLIAYDGQAQPTASTSSGTTLVRLTAPAEQDWVKDPQRHRVCRCCHARSPVWERNTVFCAGCFVMRFPDTPLDTSAQRSYWTMKRTCKTCGGGEGSRSMTWNCAPTDYSCKCCGKKRQRMERKSQTCEGCFERNTGMPMPPGLGTADKRARPCANCPAAAPSSSQHHNAANPPSSSGFRSSKRPPPARDVGEALLLSQSSITTFIASSPSQSTPAPSSQQQDDVAPAAPHPASQSRSSKKARPSRDAGAMASLSQSSLTGFLDGSDS